MCPPHAGFVTTYGEKLTALGGILDYWPPQERSCCSCQESRTGLLCAFSFVGDYLRRWDLERKRRGMGLSGPSRNELEVPAKQ